jgi:peptidoglycan/xylan/chitin deacetylase (PgdA/CDA1 family)
VPFPHPRGKFSPVFVEENAMKSLIRKTVDLLNLYPLFCGASTNRAAVFMLHEINPPGETDKRLFTTDRLESFLEYLSSHQYNVISLTEYVDLLVKKKSFQKTVVFTVDDGYADFCYNAFPVFKVFGYPASIFLTTDFIDSRLFFWWNQIEFALETTNKTTVDLGMINSPVMSLDTPDDRTRAASLITESMKILPNDTKLRLIDDLLQTLDVSIAGQPCGKYRPLSWEQIHEMHQYGIEFYPHTKTHPIMTRISLEQKRQELILSKQRLEEQLGRPMDIFCYPNGGSDDIDEETINVLRECGYRAAVTGIPGVDDSSGDLDLFRLRRFSIPNELPVFKQIVCGLEAFKESIFG